MPIKRVVATHSYCFLCNSKSGFTTVPFTARLQAYQAKQILIPKNNRCCPSHLINGKFYKDQLSNLKVYSKITSIETQDLALLLDSMSIASNQSTLD